MPDDVLAFYREVGAKGAELEAAVADDSTTRGKPANPEQAAQLERALRGEVPRRIFPGRTFTDENGSVATRDAGGTVMNAIAMASPNSSADRPTSIPRPRRTLRTAATSSRITTPGATSTTACASTRWPRARTASHCTAACCRSRATFFNFVDYLKPALRLACLTQDPVASYVFTHDSVFLGEDGPTHEPIEQLATLRATPNCYVVRPADSLETLEAWKLAVAAKDAPWVLVLTRQKLPFLGARDAAVAKGAYVLADARRRQRPISFSSRPGSEVSLAVDAKKILDAKACARASSRCRAGSSSTQQPQSYRDEVLPPAVGARMSIEAGATLGWAQYVGDRGFAFGIDHFGASAPAAAIAKAFGFTPDNVADLALEKFALAAR